MVDIYGMECCSHQKKQASVKRRLLFIQVRSLHLTISLLKRMTTEQFSLRRLLLGLELSSVALQKLSQICTHMLMMFSRSSYKRLANEAEVNCQLTENILSAMLCQMQKIIMSCFVIHGKTTSKARTALCGCIF